MKWFRSTTFFLSAFVLTSGALLAFLHQIGLFEVSEVPVEFVQSGDGARARGWASSETRLRERLQASLQPLHGKKIWEIDLSDVRASLARDEWVQDVLISRSFPNELRIRVRPKTASFVWVDKQGDFIPVTDQGALLAALPSEALPDVPILRGEIFRAQRDKRMAAIKLVTSLSDKGPMSRRNVSEVSWTSGDGFVLTLNEPKVEVKLGEDRVELKAMRVAQVLSYMSVNDLKGRVIDASFSKKVLVRLRKGP